MKNKYSINGTLSDSSFTIEWSCINIDSNNQMILRGEYLFRINWKFYILYLIGMLLAIDGCHFK